MGSRRRVALAGILLVGATVAGAVHVSRSAARGAGAAVVISGPTVSLARWTPETDNLVQIRGTVRSGGKPVSGVRLRVDGYALPAATDAQGSFADLVDATLLSRHVVAVVDASAARIAGVPLSASEQSAVRAARGAVQVAYRLGGIRVSRDAAGRPVLAGRLADTSGTPPPTVGLYSYELTGRVTDARGRPVVGARVSTRTADRDYWTVSTPTDSSGRYSSLFTASSEQGGNPVPMTVRVAVGDLVYQYLPAEYVDFQLLQSARLDLELPPAGYPMALPVPHSFAGAIDEGIVVGVQSGGRVVRPVRESWPDALGRFTIVLPKSAAGRSVSLWEGRLQLFSRTPGRPGGPIDLTQWPTVVPGDAPAQVATVALR